MSKSIRTKSTKSNLTSQIKTNKKKIPYSKDDTKKKKKKKKKKKTLTITMMIMRIKATVYLRDHSRIFPIHPSMSVLF